MRDLAATLVLAAVLLQSSQVPASAGVDGTWILRVGGEAPGPSAILDPVRHRLISFTSTDGANQKQPHVWVLPLDGSSAWMPLTTYGTPPAPRTLPGAIYDPNQDRMVFFGGLTSIWGLPYSVGDCWTLS